MDAHRLYVVGGNNVDISATSRTPLVYGDSNPGKVRTGMGGVGRNIAENLARLGWRVSLVTAFGDDHFSRIVTAHARQTGIDLTHSLHVPGATGCVYICVNDADGEMAVAVNDMALCALLTPEFLTSKLDVLNEAEAIVLDANLDEAAILMLARQCKPPVFADAVSTKKAGKLMAALPYLAGLKVNRMELELLTGVHITAESDILSAAGLLHAQSVRYVLVTLGGEGAFAFNGAQHAFAPIIQGPVVNTTGCGDAFTAAAVTGILGRQALPYVLRAGLAAASLCARSENAVSEMLTEKLLADTVRSAQNEEANS